MQSIFNKRTVWPLLPQTNKINTTSFSASSFNNDVFTGDRDWRYTRTIDTSQISVYFGLGGFSWKTPIISLDTGGCFPTHVPSSKVTELDKALLAVSMALYVRPCWWSAVRKSSTGTKDGWMWLIFLGVQKFCHFLMQVLLQYFFFVLFCHEAMMSFAVACP